jgi:hypothetical protein
MQLRAAVAGVPIHLDTRLPAYHVYRPSQLQRLERDPEAIRRYLGDKGLVRGVLAQSATG